MTSFATPSPALNLSPDPIRAKQYAENIVRWWCNVQPGQPVIIFGSKIHEPFMHMVADAARAAGASEIFFNIVDENKNLQRAAGKETTQELGQTSQKLVEEARKTIEGRGACICITGEEYPLVTADREDLKHLSASEIAERIKAVKSAQHKEFALVGQGIMAGTVNRCVVGAATPGWAQQVFPNERKEVAFKKLEDAIYATCFMDAPDPARAFLDYSDFLEEKRERLQRLKIKSLRITGDGTDLEVALSERAMWLAGKKLTADDRKIPFFGNVPIGEIFTTPNWRGTNGHVRVTSATTIDGQSVDGIRLAFRDGLLIPERCFAKVGNEALHALIARYGMNKLGEIAFADKNNPVARTKVDYKEILYDEKEKGHFALGAGYKVAILDSRNLTETELDAIGLNLSDDHFDMMATDENTTVAAKTENGDEVPVLINGELV